MFNPYRIAYLMDLVSRLEYGGIRRACGHPLTRS